MSRDAHKRMAAEAALDRVGDGEWLGVGTGSTTNHFIGLLPTIARRIRGAVASSEATAERLRAVGIPLVELNDVGRLPLYVDGADEATREGALLKGGGGALTREKIIAAASARFVCILDSSKIVDRLGRFPLAVEVIPMATRVVAEALAGLGGRPVLRAGFTTDNGNRILDVHDLRIVDPRRLEQEIDEIPGVVCNGLFSRRPADELIVGCEQGVTTIPGGCDD